MQSIAAVAGVVGDIIAPMVIGFVAD